MSKNRVLVRPKCGHYPLNSVQLEILRSLQAKGGQESKSIEITTVDKVLDTVPKGKEVLDNKKAVGIYQTSLLFWNLTKLL